MKANHDFYEQDALRYNIWKADTDTLLYFNEILRYRKLLKLISLNNGKVLDLGCGDGYLSYLMAKRGLKVTALDLSRNRLNKFQAIAERYGITQIEGTASVIPFETESFDAIVASELIEHIPDYQSVLLEMYRVLKKDGTIVISVPFKEELEKITCPYCLKSYYPYGHLHTFDKKTLQECLTKVGFQLEKITHFKNTLTEKIKKLLNIPLGAIIFMDSIFSTVLPQFSSYIAVKARKYKLK